MCKTVSGSIAITKNEDDLSYYDLHLLKDAFNMTPKAQSIKIKKKTNKSNFKKYIKNFCHQNNTFKETGNTTTS